MKSINDYYVYLLYDTLNNEVFYVGKGRGLRFLNHLKDAQKRGDQNVESQKIQKIKSIGTKRFGCSILRRNLTEDEALVIEATTIDLFRSHYIRDKKGILNIQSGCGSAMNGIIDIKQYTSMKTKYVDLLKSETLICLNIPADELLKTTSVAQLLHKKKWKVKCEEVSKTSYTVVESNGIVIAVFNSGCWKEIPNTNFCQFNGNQITNNTVLDRLMSHKLPKRKRGTPQARYINHTDVMIAKQ